VERERYRPSAYWERLLSTDFTIGGVSHPYLPRSFNRLLYRAIERSLRRGLERRPLPWPLENCRVLDVGAGVGIWIEHWRRSGATQLAAIDLTETAVGRLRERYPNIQIEQADIGRDDVSGLGTFDLISVVNVLLHLTDDAAFATALENLGGLLEQGGVMLVVDPVVVRRSWGPPPDASANSKARALPEWEAGLSQAGLRIAAVLPVTVLLEEPVDTRARLSFRARSLYWATLCRGLRQNERLGAVIGSMLYAVDSVLVRLSRTGPSLKCLVIVRSDDERA
jgi:SAM-dependent methyltransferase